MKRWRNGRPHMSGSRLMRRSWKFPMNPVYEICQISESDPLLEPACETELVPGTHGCSSWTRSKKFLAAMYCNCHLLGSLTALQLGRWTNLQVIAVVNDCWNGGGGISVNWITPLIAAIRLGHLRDLKRLQLSSIRFQDSEMVELSKAMDTGNLSVLQSLDLHSNGIGVSGTIALSQVIKNGHLMCLQDLDLSFNKIGNIGQLALADAISAQKVPKLMALRLGSKHKGEGDEGLIMLASRLESGQLNNLKRFHVSAQTHRHCRNGYYHGMSPAGCKAFVQAYRKNPLLIVSVVDQMWSSESLKWSAKKFLERNQDLWRARTKSCSEVDLQSLATG